MPRTLRQMPVDVKTDRYVWLLRFLIASIFLALTIWSVSPLWQRLRQRRELTGLRAEMTSSKREEKHLRQEIDKLQNDNDYIEMMARKKLGMVRPGEESYLVIEGQMPGDKIKPSEIKGSSGKR